ncbi:hypothetical protein GTG23_31005 [Rhodococcus hoagii]|nr:hypothetical protein [Prescottella equi]
MTHTTEYPTRYMRDRARAARTTAPLRPFAWPSPDATESEARALRRALLERDEPSAALVRAIREDRTVTLGQFRRALAEGIDAVPDAPDPCGPTSRCSKPPRTGWTAIFSRSVPARCAASDRTSETCSPTVRCWAATTTPDRCRC